MGMLRHAIFRRLHSRLAGKPLRELGEFMAGHEPSDANVSTEAVKEPPYLGRTQEQRVRKVFIETYGCQMNFNDTEIVLRILNSSGFARSESLDEADAVLLMTCAIRENAEDKIWRRLEFIHSVETKSKRRLVVGILGCMAERLKQKLLEKDKNVDLICGPDSYRDLPNLIRSAEEGHVSANVLLSADETYADLKPVRIDANQRSAFLSIMRGCNNMCAFCIVPFTRFIQFIYIGIYYNHA
jgi:tRNA A37 methylthiotransferase MiaB